MLGHKTSLSKFKEDKIYIRYIFWPERYESIKSTNLKKKKSATNQKEENGQYHTYMEIKQKFPEQVIQWGNF